MEEALLKLFKTSRDVSLSSSEVRKAITDWPTENLSEPCELISELKVQINAKLTFENIDKFMKTLHLEKDAWKMESLKSVLEIFDFERDGNVDKEVELEVLLERIASQRK